MGLKSASLDIWRDYFRTANSDIFDIINWGIMVAALDCPKEFRLRRDRIAEMLFTCRLTRCSGCDRVELAVPREECEDENGCKSSGCDRVGGDDDDGDYGFEAGGSKESKVNSSRGDDHADRTRNQISNYSYGEAEALTDEMDEESQIVGEVFRIKEILLNCQDESDSVLFDSLRRLQLMALTVDTLQATEIGKAVNGLRKHGSKQIRNLTRTLIIGWKDMVDEWVNSTKGITEGTPDSVNPSVLDEEEGLPSPPMDEGVFFATQPTGIELSQFFDGMDDDGNPRNGGEFIKNRENGRKPSLETPNKVDLVTKDTMNREMRRQEAQMKPNKPSNTHSGPQKPPKQSMEHKLNNEAKSQQKPDKVGLQQKPLNSEKDKYKCSDEDAVRIKLEATKRKLQERYQQVENAKKQRTTKVMELQDLPKQVGHKFTHGRPGNYNRHWANGRR